MLQTLLLWRAQWLLQRNSTQGCEREPASACVHQSLCALVYACVHQRLLLVLDMTEYGVVSPDEDKGAVSLSHGL